MAEAKLPKYCRWYPSSTTPCSITVSVPTRSGTPVQRQINIEKAGGLLLALAEAIRWRNVIGRSEWRDQWRDNGSMRKGQLSHAHFPNKEPHLPSGVTRITRKYMNKKQNSISLYKGFSVAYQVNGKTQSKVFFYGKKCTEAQALKKAISLRKKMEKEHYHDGCAQNND